MQNSEEAITRTNSYGETIILSSKLSEKQKCSSKDFVYDNISQFAVGENITVVGFTSKEYISSYKTSFTSQPMDNRLSTGVIYLVDKYKYKYSITIPHGYILSIPSAEVFNEKSKTGFNPLDEKKPGYNAVLISKSTNGDRYDLETIINQISYNISGQSLGFTSYMPFRVGTPEQLIWKYKYNNNDWGEFNK